MHAYIHTHIKRYLAPHTAGQATPKAPLKAAATAVIGHHDEDGIAKFLRERFDLPNN